MNQQLAEANLLLLIFAIFFWVFFFSFYLSNFVIFKEVFKLVNFLAQNHNFVPVYGKEPLIAFNVIAQMLKAAEVEMRKHISVFMINNEAKESQV